jgi:hypothetical protein
LKAKEEDGEMENIPLDDKKVSIPAPQMSSG